ncbi:recombinase family protein, partial [Salmonella enterica]|nr:recombinase family protein [Salmonella enterica]MCH6052607.1 recombinase family protein [Salmonella enterica]MCH6066143.1 recombinase family protein [Salmonella enterica]MCH6070510.1 recombinase family protein [Salmonella enterica]MCH6074894.1 recombinase family protein [Salmonella enterica]
MALYGYARVSTSDQDLTLQTQILRAAGCEIIRAEKASGSGRTGRSELQLLLEFLRPGDTLMVTRVDRLARSIKDLQDIVYALNQQGVTLGTVAKLAMRQPFVLFKGLTFQKLCL